MDYHSTIKHISSDQEIDQAPSDPMPLSSAWNPEKLTSNFSLDDPFLNILLSGSCLFYLQALEAVRNSTSHSGSLRPGFLIRG